MWIVSTIIGEGSNSCDHCHLYVMLITNVIVCNIGELRSSNMSDPKHQILHNHAKKIINMSLFEERMHGVYWNHTGGCQADSGGDSGPNNSPSCNKSIPMLGWNGREWRVVKLSAIQLVMVITKRHVGIGLPPHVLPPSVLDTSYNCARINGISSWCWICKLSWPILEL